MKTYEYREKTWKTNYTVKAIDAKSAKNKINKHQGFTGTIASGHSSAYKKHKNLE